MTIDNWQYVGIGTQNPNRRLDVAGQVGATDVFLTGQLQIKDDNPTITFRDTDHMTGYIHMNGNAMYFLGGSNNSPHGSWTKP
jgi:hypothetical protein